MRLIESTKFRYITTVSDELFSMTFSSIQFEATKDEAMSHGQDDFLTGSSRLLIKTEDVLSKYIPAYAVANENGEVLLRSAQLERYLDPNSSAPAAHLADLVCQDLRPIVRRTLEQAAQGFCVMRTQTIPYKTQAADGAHIKGRVSIIVEPVAEAAESRCQFVVVFLEVDGSDFAHDPASLIAQQVANSVAGLSSSQELFRLVSSIVPAFLFTTDVDLTVRDMNEPFHEYTGLPSGQGLPGGWASVMHPDDVDENDRRWLAAARAGSSFDHEHRLRAADGSWRWFLSRSVPQHDGRGQVVQWFGSSIDVHQRREDQRRQRLLLAEVQHRAKNILASVRSLLSRTLETANNLDDFAAHLSGRIAALARTQTALGRTLDATVELEELAHQEITAPGGHLRDRASIEGPNVTLNAKLAETLGLVLHELTTNSLKFGALSAPDGVVTIRWAVHKSLHLTEDETLLAFVWEENGAKLVQPSPSHLGFGRELIEYGLPYEFGARTEFILNSEGMICRIELRLQTTPENGPFWCGPK